MIEGNSILKPLRKLHLADRPWHSCVSEDGNRFAACARSGMCCLFDDDLRQVDEIDLGPDVVWVQLNETGSLLAAGFHDHVEVFATAGNISSILKVPVPETDGSSCCFRGDEHAICVASWDREPKLTAWEIASSSIIDEALLPRVRGAIGYALVPHPEGEVMAAVAYSGQSEEWMFWAHYAGRRLRVFDQPEIEGVAFPCFHPTGREFVSFHERLGLGRMRFPSGELIGSTQPEQAFPDNPVDTFSYDMHYLRDHYLLVWQTNLALYEFDLRTMRPTRVLLTGVEGMTFGKDNFFSGQSWQLAAGRLLTSDCHHDNALKNQTNTLRLWDASELFGPSVATDPMRPYTKDLVARG